MIVSSDAIVLKAIKYGETSRIVTFYTKQHGKVTAIAKGARGPKSKFSPAALQPMSISYITFYMKESRDIQILSNADLVMQCTGTIDSAEKLGPGLAVIETMSAVLQGEERHVPMFDALQSALLQLNAAEKNPLSVYFRFLLELSAVLGFGIDFDHCVECRKSFHEERLSRLAGSTVPHLVRAVPVDADGPLKEGLDRRRPLRLVTGSTFGGWKRPRALLGAMGQSA